MRDRAVTALADALRYATSMLEELHPGDPLIEGPKAQAAEALELAGWRAYRVLNQDEIDQLLGFD